MDEMADAFFVTSAIVFVLSAVWFLLRPRWWAETICRRALYGEFWASRVGMVINRILAVMALTLGILILLGYAL
jgi:hypothetical protein